ncbi:bifunctional PGK/TIM [archaeon BMS3Bbin16]|nr:bifunctional PGK/TIM [archaeon BMS3Bbin16]
MGGMAVGLHTLDDFDLRGKKVLLRADINSPLDPMSGEILDTSRIKGYVQTLERLKDSKVILIAHQSRPGKGDFTTLRRHSEVLNRLVKGRVSYIDDVFGSCAKKGIDSLSPGEVLVLENMRFCSEEVSKRICGRPPIEQAKTHLVRRLSSYVDFYVNDAFAVSHRAQPSVVGFPMVLPCCIGPSMEREITALTKVLKSKETPKVFALGGAKADDSFLITKNVLLKGVADKVLLSGVAALIFLMASGKDIGSANRDMVKDLGYNELVSEAGELLKRFKGQIELPVDLAFEDNGGRSEASVDGFPDKKALDIGAETMKVFSKAIKDASVVIAKGPAGVFEINGFGLGTESILQSIADSKALSVIGGGHLTTVAKRAGLRDKISYIGSGGGATVSFLSDQPLPGIEVMKKSGGGEQ